MSKESGKDNFDRYQKFRKAYQAYHHVEKWTPDMQKQVAKEWNVVKKDNDLCNQRIQEYLTGTAEKSPVIGKNGTTTSNGDESTSSRPRRKKEKSHSPMPSPLPSVASSSRSRRKKKKTPSPMPSPLPSPPASRSASLVRSDTETSAATDTLVHEGFGSLPKSSEPPIKKKTLAKEQDKLSQQISDSTKLIASLQTMKERNLLNDVGIISLKHEKKTIDEATKRLKRLQQNRLYQARCREKKKTVLAQMVEKHPELQTDLSSLTRKTSGRPSLETRPEYTNLQRVIQELAQKDSAALTLDNLVDSLAKEGMPVSRSAAYLRLQPRRIDSREGKRHTNSVPVKLGKPHNESRSEHVDTLFASSTVEYLQELPEVLGVNQVFLLNQDDKARISLGLSNSTVPSSPLLLKWTYTPNPSDSKAADTHTLKPTVYAARVFADESRRIAATFSGPTYVTLRHTESTARDHCQDLMDVLKHSNFNGVATDSDGTVKPVVIVTTDNGAENCPRSAAVIASAVDIFRTFSLDAMFVASHAPGHCAYNAAERHMAPLSKDLSDLVFPFDEFGSHLDESGQIVDDDLQRTNLRRIADCICEVWNENVVDGYPMAGHFVEESADTLTDSDNVDSLWRANHVRVSQYLTQMVKCRDSRCCQPFRSSYGSIFPERFLPGPICYTTSPNGMVPADADSLGKSGFGSFLSRLALRSLDPHWKFGSIPYDFYCPSMWQKDSSQDVNVLESRTCPKCRSYDASEHGLDDHHCVPAVDILQDFLTFAPCITGITANVQSGENATTDSTSEEEDEE